jgi:hypothetical protein
MSMVAYDANGIALSHGPRIICEYKCPSCGNTPGCVDSRASGGSTPPAWISAVAKEIAGELCYGAKPFELMPTALRKMIEEKMRKAASPDSTGPEEKK